MNPEKELLHADDAIGEIEVQGRVINYHDTGLPGDGRVPVVLVHGTGGTTSTHFRSIYPMLAARHRVIGIDTCVEPGVELEQLREQVHTVVEQRTNGGRYHLVGYSLGAVIAASLAGQKPERIQTLSLVAGWMKTDTHQRLRNNIWTRIYETGSERMLQEFQTLVAHSSGFLRGKTEAELEDLIRARSISPAVALQMQLNAKIDISDDVAQIEAPTLVIGCQEDQMVPIDHSYQLFGGIANSRLAEVNSGHAVTAERPAQVFMLVDDFIRNPSKVASGDLIPALTI